MSLISSLRVAMEKFFFGGGTLGARGSLWGLNRKGEVLKTGRREGFRTRTAPTIWDDEYGLFGSGLKCHSCLFNTRRFRHFSLQEWKVVE